MSLEYFFFPETDVGFDLYGPEHIAWLAYCVILALVLIATYRRLPEGLSKSSPRRRMLVAVAAAPLALLTVHKISLGIRMGYLSVKDWPLFTCNFCEVVALVYALKPNKFCGEVLFAVAMPGALAALLFPAWNDYPPLVFETICGFTEHVLTLAFALMLIFGNDFKPDIRRIWQPLAFLAAYAAFICPFNWVFDTNYGFTNRPAKGTLLVYFQSVIGSFYLLYYAGTSLSRTFQERAHTGGRPSV